ncbi:cupin domain-containing protein [Pusillimonas noertemannii]|uniref:Cupin type-2 domain-containing protein n=1 Tax=Pusillimonas noertemannii TaxID=305977 RepID=A0A2U1CH30_9BURK|nr:cupin domain-containing protein [Pusillimonas noertemannii]PVY60200.1 hypothetical protein C7440_3914 [Pusillimonas noertemannii]
MKIRARHVTAWAMAGMVMFGAAAAHESSDPSHGNHSAPHASAGGAQAPASGIQVETLLKAGSSWDGVAYKAYPQGQPQLTVIRLTIPPHTTLPWHTHPMPNAAYVVSGQIVVEKQSDGQKRTLGAGEVLAEMVDTLHRGTTGDEPVVLMVFYAGTPDMPLSKGH